MQKNSKQHSECNKIRLGDKYIKCSIFKDRFENEEYHSFYLAFETQEIHQSKVGLKSSLNGNDEQIQVINHLKKQKIIKTVENLVCLMDLQLEPEEVITLLNNENPVSENVINNSARNSIVMEYY